MILNNFIKDCVLAVVIICIFCGLFALTFAFNDVSPTQTIAVAEMPRNQAAVAPSLNSTNHIQEATAKVPETISSKPTEVQSKKKNIDSDNQKVASKKDESPTVQPIAKIEKVNPQVTALPQASADEDEYPTDLISLINAQTNKFRKKHDVAPLGYSATLEMNAKKYSSALLARGILSHTDKNNCDMSCRFNEDNYKANAFGENLAMLTFSQLPDVTEVATYFMREWEKSSGHRANLLSPSFTTQGVGVTIRDGNIYVAVHFSDSL